MVNTVAIAINILTYLNELIAIKISYELRS